MFVRPIVVAGLIAFATIGSRPPCVVAGPQYNIVPLSPLPGGESIAFGLNDVGQVVGDSRKDRSTHIGQSRPVVWNYRGEPTELWADQSVGGSLWDINNAGEIVGRYGSGEGIPLPGPGVPYGRAFYWSEATGRIDIGFEPVGNSQAMAINNLGQVVGTSDRLEYVEIEPGHFEYQFIPHPFIWDKQNGIRDLGTLGGFGGFATAINDLGQVVGYADLPSGYERAFIWDDMGGLRELPTLGGNSTRATAINSMGQVLAGETGLGAYLWDNTSGPQSVPVGGYGLNSLGRIVGGSIAGLAIWDQANGVQQLVDLISANTAFDLEIPFAINDASDIVGYGLLNERIHGFLLVPVPEPTAPLTLFFGLMPLCLLTRKGWMLKKRKRGHSELSR